MSKITCVECQRRMERVKSGITLILMAFDPPQPYQLIQADVHRCVNCGFEIVGGAADRPYAEHFQPDFEKHLAQAMTGYTVRQYERNHAEYTTE